MIEQLGITRREMLRRIGAGFGPLGLAGVMMVLLGLYLGGWWMGLGRVETLGRLLWRRIEPLGRRFLPVRSPWEAMALGAYAFAPGESWKLAPESRPLQS